MDSKKCNFAIVSISLFYWLISLTPRCRALSHYAVMPYALFNLCCIQLLYPYNSKSS